MIFLLKELFYKENRKKLNMLNYLVYNKELDICTIVKCWKYSTNIWKEKSSNIYQSFLIPRWNRFENNVAFSHFNSCIIYQRLQTDLYDLLSSHAYSSCISKKDRELQGTNVGLLRAKIQFILSGFVLVLSNVRVWWWIFQYFEYWVHSN